MTFNWRHILSAIPNTALMICIGLLGAVPAFYVGLPMPFLMGALMSVGLYSAVRTAVFDAGTEFPKPLRRLFIAVIGVMIGASFSTELMRELPSIWSSLLLMSFYVVACLVLGFVIFRHVGGLDRVTSFYSAMPGGLIESVSLGEAAGGDVKTLALQHFVRIVLVVIAVPMLYWIWSGNAVGSAGGQEFSTAPWSVVDIVELFALAAVGMWLGPKLRLPAAHMVGPLVLSAALHGADWLHVVSPNWLLAIAQLFVGTALGTSFAGTRPQHLFRAFGLGSLYMIATLGLAFCIAAMLNDWLPFEFDTLFVSFAPGGVTEMGLIALSLGISPVIVTAHHIFRIALTIAIAAVTVGRV